MGLFLLEVTVAQAQRTYLHCGRIADVEGRRFLNQMTIIVDSDTIQSIEKDYLPALDDGDKVVDLSDHTVLPGLFDMHVHMEFQQSRDSYMKDFTENPADIAFESAVYAKATLLAGFTTVRDLGGSGVNIALRNAINKGLVAGPRMYSAGKAIGTTGGHADPTNGYRRDLMGDPGPVDGVINGTAEAMKAVRQRYKNGADVIKVMATAGVLSIEKDGSGPQMTMEELRAVVQIAGDYGMLTAAHAHGDEGIRRAVLAGINTIEHGTYMSEETMDLMISHGTWYCPTITAGKTVEQMAKIPGYYPDVIVPKALAIGPQIQSTFAKACAKGVKIIFGTDAGVYPHGENAREFTYMVDGGMKPWAALRSATIVPAKLLKADDRTGSIAVGKYADIIAVPGNPIEDISIMEKVDFVMKGGVVYKERPGTE